MSVVKRIIKDNIEKVAVDELLADEYDQAGYGGIALTKTPLGTQINLFAMRPGRVIGKRGRAIKDASARLENELNITNPQITVVEVEVPELNPQIMAARIANALERGVHYRRSLFWSLNRTMESGALGCEIVVKGPLRSNRGRFEKVSEGYVPKSGDPALRYVKKATVHVKMKKGTIGVTVSIVAPDAKFPDKVNLDYLPEIDYPEEEIVILPAGVEPDIPTDDEAPVEDTPVVEPTAAVSEPDIPKVVEEPTVESVIPDVSPEEKVEESMVNVEEPVVEVETPEIKVPEDVKVEELPIEKSIPEPVKEEKPSTDEPTVVEVEDPKPTESSDTEKPSEEDKEE